MPKKSTIPASTHIGIDVLRSFLAVVQSGGVTQASSTIGRTPAALSMQITKLESIVGRTLFSRGSQGMALTPDGESLLSHARRLVELHDDTLNLFREPQLTGELRFGLLDEYSGGWLTRMLCDFADTHPAVSVNVTISTTKSLSHLLDEGGLDLALMSADPEESMRADDQLVHREPLVWAGLAGGRARYAEVVPIAVADFHCAWRKMAIDALRSVDRPFRIAYTSDQFSGQAAALHADLAVAAIPKSSLNPLFEPLSAADGWPPLGSAELIIRQADRTNSAANVLRERVENRFCAKAADYECRFDWKNQRARRLQSSTSY
ncbi:LysR family transcriptional regulator [Gammaproteobacteria bacterium]|nr:LysR family transcriptional regulator [Gammaproteobacteria bacterium]